MNHTLLVILPHPDDESFPMGGTLAKYAAHQTRVTLVCATRGETGIPGVSADEAGKIREGELRRAAEALGLNEVRFLDYRDGTLAQVDAEKLISRLTDLLCELQPDAVLTFGPDGISGHPDHVTLSARVTQAFERAHLPGRLFYLMPSKATQQGCGIPPSNEAAGGPVATIDIGAYLVAKVRAMQAHASQDPPYPGDPVEEAGKLTCHEYFILARPITVDGEMSDLFTH
jgi:LmbE family N-acetylglucosaminyl deacetylase